MAKGSGDTRVSKWSRTSQDGKVSDLYFHEGKRVEYYELSESERKEVIKEKTRIANALYQKLRGKTTEQVIDEGVKIEINYTHTGIEHLCNDAMLILSGKYFSEKSMMRIDEILASSTYMPSTHESVHPRKDGRDLWFSYMDGEGRGVYFKVTWNKNLNKYELYSVSDKKRDG